MSDARFINPDHPTMEVRVNSKIEKRLVESIREVGGVRQPVPKLQFGEMIVWEAGSTIPVIIKTY